MPYIYRLRGCPYRICAWGRRLGGLLATLLLVATPVAYGRMSDAEIEQLALHQFCQERIWPAIGEVPRLAVLLDPEIDRLAASGEYPSGFLREEFSCQDQSSQLVARFVKTCLVKQRESDAVVALEVDVMMADTRCRANLRTLNNQ